MFVSENVACKRLANEKNTQLWQDVWNLQAQQATQNRQHIAVQDNKASTNAKRHPAKIDATTMNI